MVKDVEESTEHASNRRKPATRHCSRARGALLVQGIRQSVRNERRLQTGDMPREKTARVARPAVALARCHAVRMPEANSLPNVDPENA